MRDAFTEPPDEERASVLGPYPGSDVLDGLWALQIRIADQRHRMDADVVRDDELGSREPDPWFGIRDRSNARLGSPTMSITCVRVAGTVAASTRST